MTTARGHLQVMGLCQEGCPKRGVVAAVWVRRENRASDAEDFCPKLYCDENWRRTTIAGGETGTIMAYSGASVKESANKLMVQGWQGVERERERDRERL